MSLLLVLVLMLLIDLYVYQGVLFFSEGAPYWIKIVWRTSYWIISLFSMLAVGALLTGRSEKWPSGLVVNLRTLIIILYLSKTVFALFLMIDDIRRIFTWISRKLDPPVTTINGRSQFLVSLALLAGALPFGSLIYGMVRNKYRYKTHRIKITPKGLQSKEPLRIVQISDIHSGSFTSKESVMEAIHIINDLTPDFVCFTGDLVNNQASEMDEYKEVFRRIKARHGIFSVLGNHDYGDYVRWPDAQSKRDNLQMLKNVHREMGWDLLLNEHRLIDWQGQQIAFIGVENYSALPQFPKYGNLQKAYRGCENAVLKVLLSHDPTHWESEVIRQYEDIDLTLSGHTHGFQFGVEIPGIFRWSPSQYVYKQWAGLYSNKSQHLYVNRGLGFLGYPGRVGILPEITLIEVGGL